MTMFEASPFLPTFELLPARLANINQQKALNDNEDPNATTTLLSTTTFK
jgi:hypothetical protein